jgi:hypothetical protein
MTLEIRSLESVHQHCFFLEVRYFFTLVLPRGGAFLPFGNAPAGLDCVRIRQGMAQARWTIRRSWMVAAQGWIYGFMVERRPHES